jgi:AhpD family alkylhydroperoxidase
MSVQPPTLHHLHPSLTNEFSAKFLELTDLVFVDGALSAKTKELIAVAAAHVMLCDLCINCHTLRAVDLGATKSEVTEAIWVGIAMRAGAAVHRSRTAFSTMEKMGL